MIKEIVEEQLLKKRKISPVHTNRASEIGHPCLRYLYYLRTAWNEQPLPSLALQIAFEEGKLHEKAVLRLLEDANIEVIEQQRPFEIKKLRLTGHIDAKIRLNKKTYPIEIKSMSPHIFDSIRDVKDFLGSKYAHVKKIPYQLQAYLLLAEEDEGILILKNRASGEVKDFVVLRDIKMQGEIIKKCEKINQYVEAQIVPEFQDDISEDTCSLCPFVHICMPEVVRKFEVEFVYNQKLNELLERREQLKKYYDEYREIEKELNKVLEGKNIVVGNFWCTGQWVKRSSYVVPETTYWRKKIVRLK